jgi:hypothetical protein
MAALEKYLPPDDLIKEGPLAPLFAANWTTAVVKTPDADLRSHMITLTYFAYSRLLDDFIHGSSAPFRRWEANRSANRRNVNANWFAFATWATASVGRNIRLEEAPQRLGSLPSFVRRRIAPAVIHARASDGQRVSKALSWGQRLIFVNIVNECRRMVELPSLSREDVDALSQWNSRLLLNDDHRQYLDEAFACYGKARAQDKDSELRAKYVLLANVLLTAVEQDLVDGAVGTVVNFLPQRVTGVINGYVSQLGERFLRVPRQLTLLRMLGREGRAGDVTAAAWARLLTDQVFVMTLPCETLRVGRDVPHPNSTETYYPACLRDLDDIADDLPDAVRSDMTRLAQLVWSFDRSRGAGAGTAATDWRRFDERMNWALALLRSRQQDDTVFWPPYRVEDIELITRRRLPQRGGDPADLQVLAPADGSAATQP